MGLDTVELAISVEKLFDIEITNEVAEKLDTVGKLHAFVVAELIRLERERINPDIVFDQLCTVICAQLGVKPSQVVPEARFIQDLDAD
jgi:acyl carrier protein